MCGFGLLELVERLADMPLAILSSVTVHGIGGLAGINMYDGVYIGFVMCPGRPTRSDRNCWKCFLLGMRTRYTFWNSTKDCILYIPDPSSINYALPPKIVAPCVVLAARS